MTPTRTAAGHGTTRTTLSFSPEDDHCRYDPQRILAALNDDDRAVIDETFPAAAQDWTTSIALYSASDELDELGHRDLATIVGQHIHAENIYGCLCRNETFETFKEDVTDVLSEIGARFPHGTWWNESHLYANGHPDADALLEDVGWNNESSDTVTITLDHHGNGTIVAGSTVLELRAFTTPELGTLLQNLDAGDLLSDEADPVGTWLQLPANIQETMAALHFHDVCLPATGPFSVPGRNYGMDLWLTELEQLAQTLQAQPGLVPRTVLSLLPEAAVPLDDLVSAAQAACLP